MTTLAELVRWSFYCEEGMLLLDRKVIHINRYVPPKGLSKVYNTKDGVLAFIDEDGKLYVTKWTDEKHGLLENLGFQRKGFEVPFTKGERPSNPYWGILLDRAMEKYD